MAITRGKAIAIAKLEKSTLTPTRISKPEAHIIAEAAPSEYENVREKRIKENRERLEKLGIVHLSLQLNVASPKPTRKKWERIIHHGPRRRSFRLSGETPVWACLEPKKRKQYERKKVDEKNTYEPNKKLKKLQRNQEDSDSDSDSDTDSEEHEKLLGNTRKDLISVPEQPIIAEAPPSEYEHVREQRIKENRERLEKLGITHLSLQLNAPATPKPSGWKGQRIIHHGPPRRSSRLSGETPVSSTNAWDYLEPKKRKKYERKKVEEKRTYEPKKKQKKLQRREEDSESSDTEAEHEGPKEKKAYEPKKEEEKKENICVPKKKLTKSQRIRKKEDQGPKGEVYTEEHEKLLGNTQKEWTLCVDGYEARGSRIYDPLNGKTCHQCRQKTLGLRTHCCKCNQVTGQFCGDCLYMRYGEHVVEANENPDWICPPCRGICNCSLCRKAKGWPPTGLLYRKIKNLGFKSVAHYLITTKRASPSSKKVVNIPQSVKRSLPFEGMEIESDNRSEMELNIDGRKPEDMVGSSEKRSEEETGDGEKESVITNTADSNEDSIASCKTKPEEQQNLV